MFICWLSPNKKKKLHSTRVYQTWVLCNFFFLNGTRAWYTRVLCCVVLEFTKLEYHIIFLNCTNSNSVVPRWQNWWGTQVSETRVLKKVVLCYLFPKQCFFAKNFQKMWYLAILASSFVCVYFGPMQIASLSLSLSLCFIIAWLYFFICFTYL